MGATWTDDHVLTAQTVLAEMYVMYDPSMNRRVPVVASKLLAGHHNMVQEVLHLRLGLARTLSDESIRHNGIHSLVRLNAMPRSASKGK